MLNILESLPAAITAIFTILIVSYYALFFLKIKKPPVKKIFRSITVIIPAHNEAECIEGCIRSVLAASFEGKKQVIVVDDGSKDDTYKIASKLKGVEIIRTSHSGKSASLNAAIKKAKGELIAVVDADSTIHKDSLAEMAKDLGRGNTAAACCAVKVKNRDKLAGMWSHIEQLYNSLMRSIFSKIGANITTPGPLSMYRKTALIEIGGFSTEGLSEDIDIGIRMIRAGHKVTFTEKAVAETNIPYDAKGFFRQRARFARGMLNILRRHMRLNRTMIDLYTLPIFLFSYIQAVIMGSFTLYQIASGYLTYFVSKGVFFSPAVLKFFFEWLSIVGFAKWSYSVLIGATTLDFITAVGIVSTLLSYPLFFIAIIKFDRKFDLLHLIPLAFMFPFWLMIMAVYIICLPGYFERKQRNIWKKNE
ncbi:glycosyltransferase family 2 protein [Candidatus Woesearchaeota archaeon]|nr:glycosyltransferase family 2 protein [Candidatus Woesearchaeota archaeon]